MRTTQGSETASSVNGLIDSTPRSGIHAGHRLEKRTARSLMKIVWMLLGPGLLVMIGDNDAGGVISYAATGATYGLGFFVWFVLALAPVTYAIQEMTMRLSTVSQQPFPILIFRRFGRFWGSFSLLALFAENLLTLVTEFIGMSVGLSVIGIPFWIADLLSMICVVFFALFGKYWTKERLALFIGMLNAVFVWIAIVTHPNPAAVLQQLTHGSLFSQVNGAFLFFVVATIGKPMVGVSESGLSNACGA